MKTIAVTTIGCKTNQYETEAILNQFIKSGYKLVDFSQSADIYLINTCCVTNRAEYKSRYAIRKAIANKSITKKVIVAGCYVEQKPQFLEKLQNQIIQFKNDEKSQIFNCIINNFQKKEISKSSNKFVELTTDRFYLHTRAPIKVQDGCDFFCSYCILPYVRGKPRSRLSENIIKQVKKLVENGEKEIVLTGINLGLYGKEFEDYDLIKLLSEISSKTDIQRIRLSSIEPMFFDKRLIEYISDNEKICPHFHIPLQSGSDIILQKMNRLYTKDDLKKVINNIKNVIPDSAIGCDVIVGFPDETDKEFEETYSFIQNLDISYLHVFRYSPRPKTASAKMKWKSDGLKNRQRMHGLTKLNHKKKKKYFNFLIDNQITLKAVLETKKDGYWTSVSDHYVRVYLKDGNSKHGELKNLRSKKIHPNQDGIIVNEK